MSSDSKFWLGVWFILGASVCSLAAIVAHQANRTNELIASAKTCEAAVMLQGGTTVEQRLMICAMSQIKEQQK